MTETELRLVGYIREKATHLEKRIQENALQVQYDLKEELLTGLYKIWSTAIDIEKLEQDRRETEKFK